MYRFQAFNTIDNDQVIKIRKAVDLYEYSEFKELIKMGGQNNI